MVAVTLKIKPRSNKWYVLKGIVKGNYLINKNRLSCTNCLQNSQIHPPLDYIGYRKLEVIGQRSKVRVT